jgi:predicted subunit of tRNA(5-methylaminomethyl-2-thiouridylate) methyltransferase
MKVKVDDLEISVRDILYRQKKELQGEFADVYINGTDKVKQKEFNSLLASVAEIAFVNPSEFFKKYDYDTELRILTQTMMDYLQLSNQSKKVDGD